MESLEQDTLQQEYEKLFPKGENCYKLTHHLTILPHKDDYLLLHGITGKAVLIEKKIFDKIVKDLNQKELDETGKQLLKQHFILPESLKEKDFVRLVFKEAAIKESKKCDLTLTLTLRCNFACPYCYETEKNIDITPEIIDKALAVEFEKAKKFNPVYFQITFFGGEPLLCPEMMAYAVKKVRAFCKKQAIIPSFTIITNGSIFNPRIAELFAAEKDLDIIQITLDGPKEIHDRRRIFKSGKKSFDVIMKNIPMWMEIARDVAIRVNVDRENAKKLPKLLEELNLCEKKKLIFFLGNVYNHSCQGKRQGKGLDILSYKKIEGEFYYKAKVAGFGVSEKPLLKFDPIYCSASCGNPAFIGPKGGYYSCNKDFGIKSHNVGNVFTGYNEKKASRWLKYNVVNLKHCLSCKHIFFCGGPCPARAINGETEREFCGDGFRKYVKKHLNKLATIADLNAPSK